MVIGFDWLIGHEISPSNIPRTVWRKITIFYLDIHSHIVFSHIGYDAIIYFWPKFMLKNCRKIRLRRLLLEFLENGRIAKLYRLIEGNHPHKPSSYDITSCFRSAFIEVRNATSDGFICIKSNAVLKASSNFSSEEYRQRFRFKRRGISPGLTIWLLVRQNAVNDPHPYLGGRKWNGTNRNVVLSLFDFHAHYSTISHHLATMCNAADRQAERLDYSGYADIKVLTLSYTERWR